MKIESCEGIILSETNYSESSKILNVFTKEFGLIGVMSKGSRNMENVDMPTNDDIPNDTTDSSDPFADFGAKIEVSDSELPF